MEIQNDFDLINNSINVGANITLTGYVRGRGNSIVIGNARNRSLIRLEVSGNNNQVAIDDFGQIRDLKICIGSHFPANNAVLQIANNFSCEEDCRILLYNHGNRCSIAANCMFSSSITIRCGEAPHLIFDKDSGEYLDVCDGVTIGEHVWIGEGAYLTKRATVPAECIVGAHSVVSRAFAQKHTAIAGNPARVVRENVQWVRNPSLLAQHGDLQQSYEDFVARFGAVK